MATQHISIEVTGDFELRRSKQTIGLFYLKFCNTIVAFSFPAAANIGKKDKDKLNIYCPLLGNFQG